MIKLALVLVVAVCASAAERKPVKRPARGVKAAVEAPAAKDAPAKPEDKEKTPAKPATELPKMEWKGQYGGAPEAGHRLITDRKGWEALWRVLGKDAPALDFKSFNAVAVFIGEKPTGGWTAVFDEPREKDGDTLVSYRVKAPKGFTTQAFTQPYLVRAFPKPAAGKMLVMQAASE